jgi:ligand-binding sensor domain-containing protein
LTENGSAMIGRKTKYSFFFILCVLIFLGGLPGRLNAQNDDLYFESIAPELGLSQITVACIFQDSKGFMWFGTLDGLNRFNGHSFEVFKYSPEDSSSISNNYINGITEDSKGLIWIATQNGLNSYDYKKNEFHSFLKNQGNKGLSHNKASCIYRDRNKKIWIGTEQGIDYLVEDSLTFIKRTFDNFLFNNRIFSISEDSYGNLWIGTLKGLVCFNRASDTYRIFRHQPEDPVSLSDNHVRTIFEDSNKNLWIGTLNGLNLFDPKNKCFLHFGKTVYPDKTLSNNAVRCIVEDAEKNLLIGTNEGLNIFNLATRELKKYNQKRVIRGNLNHFFIYSLFIDNAGTVWVGTFSGGINYYNLFTQQFRYFNPGNNFVYGNIRSIIEHNDELWIATGGGGLLNYDRQLNYQGQFFLNEAGTKSYSSNVVRSLLDAGNLFLIATDENNLLFFENHQKSFGLQGKCYGLL